MRKLMWFTIGFGTACCLGAYIFPEYFLVLGIFALAAGIGSAFCVRWIKLLRILAVLLLSFSLGTGWFLIYDRVFLEDARNIDGKTRTADIELTDYTADTDYGSMLNGKVTVASHEYSVIVYLYEPFSGEPGDHIKGTFRFRFTASNGEEKANYHRCEGVFLLAYPEGEISHIKAGEPPLQYFPSRLRVGIVQQIEKIFPKDASAFAKALLLGDRSGIDYETDTAFKIAGISHIIAVSGLHVSILFGIIALLCRNRRWLMFLIGVPVLVLFAAISGFTPSVLRACIMQALVLISLLLDKEYDSPTALAAAALVMLIANPMVIISISFQLSFGCMAGIFLFYERIYGWLTDAKRLGSTKGKTILARLKRWFTRSVSISISASVITTPLAAVYFGTISLISILTNLLIVWLVCYAFYGVMLACGVSFISLFAGKLLASLTVYPIRIITGIAKLLASFPLSAVYTQSRYIVVWLILSYLLFAVFLILKKKPIIIYSGVSVLILCVCLAMSWIEPWLDPCRLTLLDMGQGQCILLQSDRKTYIVDCGGSNDTAAADKAAELLLSQGITKVDGIIVTHYDTDHAGGVPYLLTRIQAEAVYLPNIQDESGIGNVIRKQAGGRAITVSKDMKLSYGSTNITIFGPEVYQLANDSGLCILFQRENCDILITGDRSDLGEMLLLHRADLPQLDVLIAGHHGSAGSTGEQLLDITRPTHVLISVGENNSYGHPAKKLLERLEAYGCLVSRTDLSGTIIYKG